LSVVQSGKPGSGENRMRSFFFQPGPVEWREGKTLDFGSSDGVGLTVLRYYPHAGVREEWLPDASGKGKPAVEYALLNAEGKTMKSFWKESTKDLPYKPGETISMGERFRLKVLQYVPSARRVTTFVPIASKPKASETPEAAVLVQLEAAGVMRQIWLLRNDPDYGIQTVETPAGSLRVSFGYQRVPLGFSLKLLRCERGMNPGGVGDASYSSTVRLIDRAAGLDEEQTISMNNPLVYEKYRFFQSGLQNLSDGTSVSTLTAAYDPGRLTKHIGCGMICLGMVMMFFLKGRGRPVNQAVLGPDEKCDVRSSA
jgi:hypothetical protein